MDQDDFELNRHLNRIEAETPYVIDDGEDDHYGWSPDGIGFYFYDTWDELVAAHGEG
jgi:hypothetical protein